MRNLLRFVVLAALVTSAIPASASVKYRCSTIFASNPNSAPRLMFPKGAPEEMGNHLMFGFESEYVPKDAAKLLRVYAPVEMDVATWLSMTPEQNVQWLETRARSKRLGDKNSGLTKITEDPELSFLPKKPIIDDTGNLEIILDPVDSYDTWLRQIRIVNERFGTGSQQSMISGPRAYLFPMRDGVPVKGTLEQWKGAYNFLNQYDILERMSEGARRFKPGNGSYVLRNFAHPYLGPISRLKQTYMHQQMAELVNHTHTFFNALTAVSSKYIGSTTPRPDIAADLGRFASEVRDAHTSEKKLVDKTERIALIFKGDREPLKQFADVLAVDTRGDFEKFPVAVQKMLSTLFPVRADQTFGYADQLFALEVARQFAYPLKDWQADIVALNRKDIESFVKLAQTTYILRLQEVENKLSKGEIDAAKAAQLVQGYAAKFADDSGLFPAYKDRHDKVMKAISEELSKPARAPKKSA